MKIVGFLLILIMLLGTAVIGIKQPPMHTRVMIYDSQYTIVDEDEKTKVDTISDIKELPTMPVENKVKKEQVVFETEQKPNVKTSIKNVETPQKVEKVKTQTSPKTTTKKKTTPRQEVVKTPVVKVVTKQEPSIQKIVTTSDEEKQQQVNVLTEQEEEIAWNVWRSNLQNQIMKDSKMPVLPIGTIFKMSFDVDKNGRVTNVQTWSTDSKYTPYAIEYIAPVIRSYQGKAILEFPKGSQRTKTTFTGGWKISKTSKYSNPNDYNDIEKVIK